MKRTLQTTICLLSLVCGLWSCDDNRLDIDVSQVEVSVPIERLDSAWPRMTALSFRSLHPEWQEEYGTLYQHYLEDVMAMGSWNDSLVFNNIQRFITHPDFVQVFDRVQTRYPDLRSLRADLEEAWKHYRFYFPGRQVPKHFSCVGGFYAPFVVTEGGIAICLENFLGSDCEFYEYLQVPLYLRQRQDEEDIVPSLMKAWVETEFPMQTPNPTMIDEIVHAGKILYALDALLPQCPDSLKIGYSRAGMDWAAAHEELVWAHFVDNNYLFSPDRSTIAKFTNDGPFTVDLAKESPPRMGHYIGWQIVRAYMQRQDHTDLEQLFQTDARQVLDRSKYKP